MDHLSYSNLDQMRDSFPGKCESPLYSGYFHPFKVVDFFQASGMLWDPSTTAPVGNNNNNNNMSSHHDTPGANSSLGRSLKHLLDLHVIVNGLSVSVRSSDANLGTITFISRRVSPRVR